MTTRTFTFCTTMLASLVLSTAAFAGQANPIADAVRAANDKYQDVAVAVADGYGPIACVSGHGGGAMGIHYINGDYLMGDEGAVDIARPEALMYEPMADGSLVLVGLEFLTLKGPAALDGHLFEFTTAPNRYGLDDFYSLHVWAWKDNPNGTFAGMNPDVSCDAQVASN